MIDHLLRGGFTFAFQNGQLALSLEGAAGGKADGELLLFAEDLDGKRAPLPLPGGAGRRSFTAGEPVQVALPSGTRRVAAVLRGTDSGGSLVAVGEARVP
jgi:hypothetical protein